jgi:hypothetical protein
MSLTATSRPSTASWARQTTPIAPRPGGAERITPSNDPVGDWSCHPGPTTPTSNGGNEPFDPLCGAAPYVHGTGTACRGIRMSRKNQPNQDDAPCQHRLPGIWQRHDGPGDYSSLSSGSPPPFWPPWWPQPRCCPSPNRHAGAPAARCRPCRPRQHQPPPPQPPGSQPASLPHPPPQAHSRKPPADQPQPPDLPRPKHWPRSATRPPPRHPRPLASPPPSPP